MNITTPEKEYLTSDSHAEPSSDTLTVELIKIILQMTEEQKRRMMDEHLLNPEEFWGEYVLPSVSRRDYAFSEQHYWRGRIWAPLNYLVYEALKDAGLYAEAKMLAEKSEKLLLLEWEKHRQIHENYSAIDGMGCNARQSDAFYHWGALLGYMALDALR